jgi:hypothetical protein
MKGRRTMLAALMLVLGIPPLADAVRLPAHTKRQAEVNLLRTVTRKWPKRRLPGIVNPRTHLLLDNTEAVCRGVGRRRANRRYSRFSCVVRPHVHRRGQGLYVTYRTRISGGFAVRWLVFRRR